MRYLVGKGSDLEKNCNKGWTPLHYAAWKNRLNIVNFILSQPEHRKELVNWPGKDGSTSLHLAVGAGHLSTVEALINHGADLRTQLNNGQTSLHLAAQHLDGHKKSNLKENTKGKNSKAKKVLELLLMKGSDVNVKDGCGKAAKDYVKDQATRKLISSYGADTKSELTIPKKRISYKDQQNFERMLTRLADDISDRSLRRLGEALRFHEVQIERFKETNRKGASVTAEGTRQMLQEWFLNSSKDNRILKLEKALIYANLHLLVETHLRK
ncbi:ankyrin repeat and death domain-containing protein 1A-like [Lytechinus pictus]|uniref:ankyrin repeat and death domain-containing protein 1A-like n=1 Tax=Lytechinus pictus TaxID=7653 RepID=UPI0030B9F650